MASKDYIYYALFVHLLVSFPLFLFFLLLLLLLPLFLRLFVLGILYRQYISIQPTAVGLRICFGNSSQRRESKNLSINKFQGSILAVLELESRQGHIRTLIKENFLHTPFPPSLISLMVSVDVKHHVYLLT